MALRAILLLHLLGAAVWVGGHLILALAVLPGALRARDPRRILDFEAGYERLGIPALLIQVLTGLWLAHRWVPDAGRWFAPGTPAEWLVLAKLVLLALTVLLALHARFRLIPRLTPATLPLLAAHIVAVTVLGVLFLVAGVGIRTGGLW
jgi:putative copper export protein